MTQSPSPRTAAREHPTFLYRYGPQRLVPKRLRDKRGLGKLGGEDGEVHWKAGRKVSCLRDTGEGRVGGYYS